MRDESINQGKQLGMKIINAKIFSFPISKEHRSVVLKTNKSSTTNPKAFHRKGNNASNVLPFNDHTTHQSKWQASLLDRLEAIVEDEYSDSEFSVSELALKVGISQRQLFRKLRALLDITPGEYIRRFRLEKAKLLLAAGKTAQFVTYEVGFSSQSYFGLCFKVHTGLSPYQYKKLHMESE